MPSAYVLINTEPNKMELVAKEIRKLKGVIETSMVYGAYDIVTKIQTDSMLDLKESVASQIRQMESVRSSVTMIVIEG
jgi:DNA-binding Lrp family transcriptional regulator